MFHGSVKDESKLKFRIYIPFGRDVDLLRDCVNSIASRIGTLSSEEKPIVIINNTLKSVEGQIDNFDMCVEMIPPVELVHAQEFNWAIKIARDNGEPFMCSIHTDAQVVDGAIEDVIEKYLEIKDTQWAWILQYASGVFGAFNPRFFEVEEVQFDPFLFPFYFMDNHMYQIIENRGWSVVFTNKNGQIQLPHVSSHFLKQDLQFQRKNNFKYKYDMAMYQEIWGGGPGSEKLKDPWANGTLNRSW
jgi:hypothetical protein